MHVLGQLGQHTKTLSPPTSLSPLKTKPYMLYLISPWSILKVSSLKYQQIFSLRVSGVVEFGRSLIPWATLKGLRCCGLVRWLLWEKHLPHKTANLNSAPRTHSGRRDLALKSSSSTSVCVLTCVHLHTYSDTTFSPSLQLYNE